MPDQGDLILIPVPFTDLKSTKRRPVIVVSNDDYNRDFQDIVVVAVTSNLQPIKYGIKIDDSDLSSGKLVRPSMVRADKIYTLSQSIVVKVLAKVNDSVLDRIREKWADLVIKI